MWDEIRPFVGAIVAVALCATNACVGSWEAVAWGMQAGALSGAAGALANGGDVLSGAAIGAFAALGYGAGGWLGGGLASGIAAESQDGQFLPAFAAAGVGAIFGGGDGVEGFMAATVGGGLASEITGGKFANGAATAAFTWALSAGLSKDEVVTNGRGSGSHEDLPKVKPDFYDDNGNPLSVHDSLEGALQAGEDASRAAQQASGQDHEYGVLTITGHVTDEGVQTYYNSAVGTSYDSHAIRWSVVGLRDNLVAINHSHPNNKGFSQGDRDAYRGLRKSGFSNFKGVYMFDDKGNHWYGPRRKTWGIFGTRTHSCRGADATSWSCPNF